MSEGIQKILERYAEIIDQGFLSGSSQGFKSYAVSNLRGGVGKSSLAFNLAYELSRKHSLLVTDLCPQCNLTEMLFGDFRPKVNVYDALKPVILGPAFGEPPEDLSYRIAQYCEPFRGGKPAYAIAGDPELFAFPSTLYQQLNLAYSGQQSGAVRKLLHGLKVVLQAEAKLHKADRILMDTSPFYAGGTHLAWCAVEALVVPVRVDEHSIDSLRLLFEVLSDPNRDFNAWNMRAGGLKAPKIAAIVMTMVGTKSQMTSTPDRASLMYIERALELAEKFASLFNFENPVDAFVLTDDFHSAGRVSGAKRIPMADLIVGSFHTIGTKRLQVNSSVTRYQRELKYLASIL